MVDVRGRCQRSMVLSLRLALASVEPRLYLLTRLIMDIAAGTAGVAAPAAR